MGARGDSVSCSTALQAGRSRVRFPMRSLGFLLTSSFRQQYGAGVDSVSNRYEYPGYLLGIKKLRGDNLKAFMCRLSKNSGILKLLEP